MVFGFSHAEASLAEEVTIRMNVSVKLVVCIGYMCLHFDSLVTCPNQPLTQSILSHLNPEHDKQVQKVFIVFFFNFFSSMAQWMAMLVSLLVHHFDADLNI